MENIDFNGLAQYGAMGLMLLYFMFVNTKQNEKMQQVQQENVKVINDLKSSIDKLGVILQNKIEK